MSLPVQADCCEGGMDLTACLSACAAVAPAASMPLQTIFHQDFKDSAIPRIAARHATMLAPPDVAPPKPFGS